MPMVRVAPGRFFDLETNKPKDPFGTWEVDYTTAFGPYRETKSRTFDMAVVTYKPINRPDLGCSEVYVSIVPLPCDAFMFCSALEAVVVLLTLSRLS